MAQTLYDKLWQSHVVHQEDDGTALIYIDRHLVHEVTSPQAFEGLKLAGRKPWRVSSIVATADHNTPTDHWDKAEGTAAIDDPIARLQVDTLDANIREDRLARLFSVQGPAPGHRARGRAGEWRDAAGHDRRLR
jgi:3-isopropylmalate/(R)-2-methylmalate dehydratase large subunit